MKNRKGFTIVELVIVIAVIAILAAVLIPTFSGVIQKANDSAALQEATSTMKSALAMSNSGTLADKTLFLVGDTSGISHSYIYSGNSIGVDEGHTITSGKFDTAVPYNTDDESEAPKYNTIILNDKLAEELAKATPAADANKVAALIKGALKIDTLAQLVKNDSSFTAPTGVKIATSASYVLTVGSGDDATYWSVFINSDFAKDVVVFTYAN